MCLKQPRELGRHVLADARRPREDRRSAPPSNACRTSTRSSRNKYPASARFGALRSSQTHERIVFRPTFSANFQRSIATRWVRQPLRRRRGRRAPEEASCRDRSVRLLRLGALGNFQSNRGSGRCSRWDGAPDSPDAPAPLPEPACRPYSGHDLARPQARRLHVGGRVERHLFLRLTRVEDG